MKMGLIRSFSSVLRLVLMCCEGEWETASCGEQRPFPRRVLVDGLEVVTSVESEPGV
jgi:hypothetical protein